MRTRRRQSLIICSICHTLVMFTFFFRCFSIAVDCDAALRDCVVLLNAHKSRLTHLISSEKCMRLLPGRTQRFRVRVERISHTITNSPELRWVYSSFCWACNVTRDECVCVCAKFSIRVVAWMTSLMAFKVVCLIRSTLSHARTHDTPKNTN